MSVVSVNPLAGGAISSALELRLSDGTSLVLKLYSDQLDWELAKEAYVYDLVRAHDPAFPLATILVADDSRQRVPSRYALMTMLEGEPLVGLLPSLADDERAALYRELGALLRRLHEIELDSVGYVVAGGVVDAAATNAEYMRERFEKRIAEFARLGGSVRLRGRIEVHVAERCELFEPCTRPVLCHNDCHDANALVAFRDGAWAITGIVDFGNAVAADPMLDLAKTFSYSRWKSDRRLAALGEGHGDLRPDWHEAIALYTLFHLLELWWWFASTGTRPEVLPELEASMAQTVGV